MKHIMKRFSSLLLAVVIAFGCGAAAFADSAPDNAPAVRVNGYLVEFPDAKPFIDENDRTLMPVRFVTEQLGATVTWTDATKTAHIEKNGIVVDIPIGSQNLSVTKDGKTETVIMDTAAVLKYSRTYVPIRFVAEALGAWVDYSDYYRVVGIYDDGLTAEETEWLLKQDYTAPVWEYGLTYLKYEDAKETGRLDAEELLMFYGKGRESFGNYANAREFLYNNALYLCLYGFKALDVVDVRFQNTDQLYAKILEEARAEVDYDSDTIRFKLHTSSACFYQPDHQGVSKCVLRGYIEVYVKQGIFDTTFDEDIAFIRYGFKKAVPGKVMYIPVDLHLDAASGRYVKIADIIPLAEPYGPALNTGNGGLLP